MSTQREMVIIIRPSFKKFCASDACQAGLYNHLLFRLAGKAKPEPDEKVRAGEIIWYASAEDICRDTDDSWGVNKVRKELESLVTAGLIGRQHNPLKKWDRKYQYFVSQEQGKVLREKCAEHGVKLLDIGLNADVLHFLFLVNALSEEEMHLPAYQVNAFPQNGGAIPKGSIKGSLTEGSINNSALTEITQLKERVDGALQVVETMQANDSYSHPSTKSSSAATDGYMNRTISNAPIALEEGITRRNSIDLDVFFSCFFDFTQPWTERAIADLARHILPSHVWPEQPDQLAACEQMFDTCVHALFGDFGLLQRGLRFTAALLCFENDPDSPSGLRQRMGRFKDPAKEIQLRLLGKPGMIHKAIQEFEQKGWWPDYLKRPLTEEPPILDLAELEGIPEEERLGFKSDPADNHAEMWVSHFREEGFPSVYLKSLGSRHAPRGQAIEIGYETQDGLRFMRLYHPGHWELVQRAELEADGGFGSTSFVVYLVDTLRPVAQEVAVAV